MRKFIITADVPDGIGVEKIPFAIEHLGMDVSVDIREYRKAVDFGSPDFSCKIQPDREPELDYIHIQSIVKDEEEDVVHWVDEHEPRTHTAVYARLTDHTLTHLADFTDREDAMQFVKIVRGLLNINNRKQKFAVGDTVVCTPKNGDFNNEFSGEIVSIKPAYMTVVDAEDNYFDVDLDQVKLV